jgi:hypothetical protein
VRRVQALHRLQWSATGPQSDSYCEIILNSTKKVTEESGSDTYRAKDLNAIEEDIQTVKALEIVEKVEITKPIEIGTAAENIKPESEDVSEIGSSEHGPKAIFLDAASSALVPYSLGEGGSQMVSRRISWI